MSNSLSALQSDFQSRVPKAVATNSQLSDLASDLKSYLAGMSGIQSDVYSLLSDLQSDFQSRVPKAVATNSQVSDLASDLKSYLTGLSGTCSDIYSLLSDTTSTMNSQFVAESAILSNVTSNLSDLTNALMNKQVVVKATGTTYIYDNNSVLAGTVTNAYTSTASDVTRKRLR
jgi:hypothetical protein